MAVPLANSVSEFKSMHLFPASDAGPCAIHNGPYNFHDAPIRIRPCQHVFGRVCFAKWLKKNNTCPTCDAVLFPMTACQAKADSATASMGPQGLFIRSDSLSALSEMSSRSTSSLSSVRSVTNLSFSTRNHIDGQAVEKLWKDFEWPHQDDKLVSLISESETTPSAEGDRLQDQGTSISMIPQPKQANAAATADSLEASKPQPAASTISLSTKRKTGRYAAMAAVSQVIERRIQTPFRRMKERTHTRLSQWMPQPLNTKPSSTALTGYEHRSGAYWTQQ